MTFIKKENVSILITGGAGFIGSHTVEQLIENGHNVRVLDNLSSGKLDNLPNSSKVQFIEGDILDCEVVKVAMTDITHVLHLAAQVSVERSIKDPINSCQQNIQGFLTVLNEANRCKARIVYASSAAVYGDTPNMPLKESSPLKPLSPYGLEKVTNEAYAYLFNNLYHMPTLGLRYFNVYGPRQDPESPYSGVITKFISMIQSQKALTLRGDGLQERDFIHVKDVAHANVAALFSNVNGAINIASGRSITIKKLTEILSASSSYSLKTRYVDNLPGDIRCSIANNSRMVNLLHTPDIELADGLRAMMRSMNL